MTDLLKKEPNDIKQTRGEGRGEERGQESTQKKLVIVDRKLAGQGKRRWMQEQEFQKGWRGEGRELSKDPGVHGRWLG